MLSVLLIRHAEPVSVDSGLNDYERPLTERGHRDVGELAASLAEVDLAAIYSSPYLRAVQTVEPLARRRGLGIDLLDDLRERLVPLMPPADWRAQLERSWRDFDYKPDGGETNRNAQSRALAVLDALRARHARGTLALGSHGTLIALMLNAIAPTVGFAFWSEIPMPAIYRLERVDDIWHLAAGPGV